MPGAERGDPGPRGEGDRSRPERTKARILELVGRLGAQTAQDLAARLCISVPAARRHLCDLQAQGLLEARTERPGGRGRPQHVFVVTERGEAAFPRTYSRLCLELLRHVEALYGPEALARVFEARADEFARRLRGTLPLPLAAMGASGSAVSGGSAAPAEPLGALLAALAAQLSQHGFEAEVRLEGGQWVLEQHNCPNLSVARQYQQLCSSELRMYTELLGLAVRRETRIACGQGSCRYLLGPVLP